MNTTNFKLKVFALGGTIDKIYFDALSEYQVGEPQVGHIFKDARLEFDIDIQSICCKDSLEIVDQDRQALLQAIQATPATSILITHGTDTMTVTAQFIQKGLTPEELASKTIVFVGAMNPACFKQSDAPFNVGFALGALRASAPGVYLAMSGCIFHPDEVQKNRAAGAFQAKTQ